MKSSKKPDEMEKAISYQAMRMTWTIINIAFIILVVFALFSDSINPISLVFLLSAELVYFAIKFVLRYNMTKGGREK